MTIYEPKLISPEGEIINIPYYEVGLFADDLCKKYREQNSENEIEFQKFASHYTYFKPCFDFMIFKLGYKMINPFFQTDKIGYTIGNYFVIKDIEINKDSTTEIYTGVSDKELGITNYKDTTLKEGFIDFNGVGFKLNRDAKMGHPKLCELLLNQYAIYNRQIYEDYIKSITDPEIKEILTTIEFYMVERLGFTHMCIFETDFGNIIYNDKQKPAWFEEFETTFKKNYQYVSFLPISEEINLNIEPLNIRKIG